MSRQPGRVRVTEQLSFAAAPEYVLSATKGKNSDLLPGVLKLYARPGQVIAEATGSRGGRAASMPAGTSALTRR